MTQRIEISSKTIVFTILFLVSLRLIWLTRELIFALFFAFIFMSALKPIVNNLERRRIPRPIAAFIVIITTIISLGFTFAFILPPIITESVLFIRDLPLLIINTFPFAKEYLSIESAIQFLPDITQNFVRVASGVFSNFIFIISIIFFTFYFLIEEQFLDSFLKKFLNPKQARRIMNIVLKAQTRMGAWMRGELMLMTIIGVLTYVGLSLLGVRFALSLAFIAGMLEVIPIIGPIVAGIPAFLVAASTSFVFGGATIVLYVIIQQVENSVIVPYVMNRAVGIHPITTLIALSVGAKLGGLLGAILAVPTALFIETVIVEILKENK